MTDRVRSIESRKGWCPSVLKPMETVDGLLVRVKPKFSSISIQQLFSLCELSVRHGNGLMDLTNRANFQLRGITNRSHRKLVDGLVEIGLGSRCPEVDNAPQILVSPMLSEDFMEFYTRLVALDLKNLSPKFGFVLDYFEQPRCLQYSGDIRIYLKQNNVLLALDGADAGVVVDYSKIEHQIKDMVDWFTANRSDKFSRVSDVVSMVGSPSSFVSSPIPKETKFKKLGSIDGGVSFALNSGQFNASQLVKVLERASFSGNIRVTPWRALYLPNCKLFDVAPYQVDEHKFFDRVNSKNVTPV